jgi:hypothetical protein
MNTSQPQQHEGVECLTYILLVFVYSNVIQRCSGISIAVFSRLIARFHFTDERNMSIDVMDVSDFDENDDVPPSPRPPAQPKVEHRQRLNSGRPASYVPQPEPRQTTYDDVNGVNGDRPPSRNRKQTPPAPVVHPGKVNEVRNWRTVCVKARRASEYITEFLEYNSHWIRGCCSGYWYIL